MRKHKAKYEFENVLNNALRKSEKIIHEHCFGWKHMFKIITRNEARSWGVNLFLRGKDCFYFILIRKLGETTKFGVNKKIWGHCPQTLPVATGLCITHVKGANHSFHQVFAS